MSSGTSWSSAAGDRDRVDAELGEDLGRRDRVRDVRLARRADLVGVGLDGEVERALDDVEVGLRVVAVDLGEELRARSGAGSQPVSAFDRRPARRCVRRGPLRRAAARLGRGRERHLRIADDGFGHARSLRPARQDADHGQRPPAGSP